MDLYGVLRPLLFALPGDMAHEISQWVFRRRFWGGLSLGGEPQTSLKTVIAGLELANPFGLAAGFDKNADIRAAVASLGFGFLVVGSVRAKPHPGNPRPWFVRRPKEDGLVNSMGLPSLGAAYVRRRLEERPMKTPLLISITGEDAGDIAQAYEAMRGLASHWEINLSCPNTATGRTFEEDMDALDALLGNFQADSGSIFLKLSPYETAEEREKMLEIGNRAIKRGYRNFTLCNTLPVKEDGLGVGRGGLSGRPLFPLALKAVKDFYSEFGDGIDIIGVGGILGGSDACEMLASGAKAVEILTALILRGPLAVRHLTQELGEIMKARRFRSVDDLIGSAIA